MLLAYWYQLVHLQSLTIGTFTGLRIAPTVFFPYGLPFTIYDEGGFAGGGSFIWSGLIADVFLMLVLGIASGWVFQKISERSSERYRKM